MVRRDMPTARAALPVLVALAALVARLVAAAAPALAAPAERPVVGPQTHPLTEVPKGRSTTEQVLRFPAWLAERPFWALGRGLEGSLTWVEQKELIEKVESLPAWLQRRHLILGLSAQGTGAGTGLLAGAFAPVGPGALIATTDWTLRRYEAHALELRLPFSRHLGLRADGRFDRRTQDNFFGIGSASDDDDRSQYRLDSVAAGLSLAWRANGWLVRGEGRWADYQAVEDPLGDDYPSTIQRFPGLPGEDGATIVSGGVTAQRPTRDSDVEVGFHQFHDADGDAYGFRRVTLTLYRAFPVFRGDRSLAFRFHTVVTDLAGGRAVPFWMLSELSARNGMRAYDAWRFRDLDTVVMNAEYRFPVWDIGVASGAAMDAVLFFDAGRVSPAIEDDLVWRELKSDGGFGFRLHTRQTALGRINVAFSSDNTRVELVTGRDF